MEVADLVLPVFAVIVTGWLAGWVGYISRSLADGLVHHFQYGHRRHPTPIDWDMPYVRRTTNKLNTSNGQPENRA